MKERRYATTGLELSFLRYKRIDCISTYKKEKKLDNSAPLHSTWQAEDVHGRVYMDERVCESSAAVVQQ